MPNGSWCCVRVVKEFDSNTPEPGLEAGPRNRMDQMEQSAQVRILLAPSKYSFCCFYFAKQHTKTPLYLPAKVLFKNSSSSTIIFIKVRGVPRAPVNFCVFSTCLLSLSQRVWIDCQSLMCILFCKIEIKGVSREKKKFISIRLSVLSVGGDDDTN
jgi:hypothetical protein